MRRLCSGKTLAFQAKDAGSIPARRSNYTHKRSAVRAARDAIQTRRFYNLGPSVQEAAQKNTCQRV